MARLGNSSLLLRGKNSFTAVKQSTPRTDQALEAEQLLGVLVKDLSLGGFVGGELANGGNRL